MSPAPQPAAVEAVIRAYDAAWSARDSIAVDSMLAPEYVYLSSRGRVVSRAQTLALLSSPQYVLQRAERTELEAHVTATTAVVASRWRGSGSYRGAPFTDDQRCSLVLVRAAEGWRIAAEHCTQLSQ
jgi:ketosteroid isomerase-like protein